MGKDILRPPDHEEYLWYKGPLRYYFRLGGIEEGAHATFFLVKSLSVAGSIRVDQVKESIRQTAKDGQPDVMGSDWLQLPIPLHELSSRDLDRLLQYSDQKIPSFRGNVAVAVSYCESLIEGVLIPLRRIYTNQLPPLMLRLVVPREGTVIPQFFFSPEESAIYVNRFTLEAYSQHQPDEEITLYSNRDDYNRQSHERRAMLWRIQDAVDQGFTEIATIIRRQYRRLS